MAAMSDPHLRWDAPYAYHRICMRHLASNFMTSFKDKLLKNLVCRAAVATTPRKMNRHMATIGRINLESLQWLEMIPLPLWALSVTPQSWGFVDYPSTRGILVNVGRPEIFHENRAESPLYGELYLNTKPAYTCPKQCNISNISNISNHMSNTVTWAHKQYS